MVQGEMSPSATTTPGGVKVRATRTNPFSNYVSTGDTVRRMVDIAKSYSQCPAVVAVLQACMSDLTNTTSPYLPYKQGYSSQDLVRAVFWWVKNHVQFQEDDSIMARIFGIDSNLNGGRDFLITPDLLLSMNPPMGDCDDFSTLVASILICGGFVRSFGRGWFVTIAADERDKDSFSHVYTKWYCPDATQNPFIYIDASHGLYPGWESPKIYRKKEWEIK